MTREEAIVLMEQSVNELREMMQTITMPQSAAEQLQQQIDSHEMAISALRQQEHFREVTKKVEPLTMDEMRDMPCEPVYIVFGCVSWWDIVSYAGMEYLYLKVEGSLPFRDYGKNWTAYRQKPEEVQK